MKKFNILFFLFLILCSINVLSVGFTEDFIMSPNTIYLTNGTLKLWVGSVRNWYANQSWTGVGTNNGSLKTQFSNVDLRLNVSYNQAIYAETYLTPPQRFELTTTSNITFSMRFPENPVAGCNYEGLNITLYDKQNVSIQSEKFGHGTNTWIKISRSLGSKATKEVGRIRIKHYWSFSCGNPANPYLRSVDISNFTITNIYVSNNSLPTFSINYSTAVIYLNDTTKQAKFYYSLVASDIDNDTIYYSNFSDTAFELYKSLKFDNEKYNTTDARVNPTSNIILFGNYLWERGNYFFSCVLLKSLNMYSFNNIKFCDEGNRYNSEPNYDDLNDITTMCTISNDAQDLEQQKRDIIYDFDVSRSYYLRTQNCTKYPIHILSPLTYNKYSTNNIAKFTIGISIESGNQVSLSPSGVMNELINTFKINKTGTITKVYNSTGGLLGNITESWFRLIFNYNFNNNQYTISAYNWSANKQFFTKTSTFSVQSMNSIKITSNKNLSIDDIAFYNNIKTFNWLTTYTNPLIFTTTGIKYINFYVTDDYHKDLTANNYVYKNIEIQVLQQKYQVNAPLKTNLISDIGYNFFHNFLVDIDMEQTVFSVMWLAYVIVFFLGFLVVRDFRTTLLINSFVFLVMGYVGLTSITMKLTCLGLLVLGLFPEISKLFFPPS